MNVVTVARGAAAAMSLIMAGYLALDGAHRPDNPFLWPDAAVAVFLAVASALPRRPAPIAMIVGFGWSAGVLTVSVFSYVVRGEFAWPNVALVVVALTAAALLGRHLMTPAARGRVPVDAANLPPR
ncbi:hypothetical protein [Nonomuraea diastatica]|uniref:Uncharacterized protein n=1 Tax=Nonomuraea diastatica TaxID=1848329 RepID=A0A4R4X533_9ACTN|nr:hypothetical protein [Nonomuraea diastatica]TDD25349.1 hypothetical protein E1294_03505 [Nonomuraea diastatica]